MFDRKFISLVRVVPESCPRTPFISFDNCNDMILQLIISGNKKDAGIESTAATKNTCTVYQSENAQPRARPTPQKPKHYGTHFSNGDIVTFLV